MQCLQFSLLVFTLTPTWYEFKNSWYLYQHHYDLNLKPHYIDVNVNSNTVRIT